VVVINLLRKEKKMKKLFVVLAMVVLMVVGCSSRRCAEFKSTFNLVCYPYTKCKKLYECETWVDRKTGREVVKINGEWVQRYHE